MFGWPSSYTATTVNPTVDRHGRHSFTSVCFSPSNAHWLQPMRGWLFILAYHVRKVARRSSVRQRTWPAGWLGIVCPARGQTSMWWLAPTAVNQQLDVVCPYTRTLRASGRDSYYAYDIYDNHEKAVLNLQSSNMNVLRTTSNVALSQYHIFNASHQSSSFGVRVY